MAAGALAIYIDGARVKATRVFGPHQRVPDPGGHHFRLELADDGVQNYFPYLAHSPSDPDRYFRQILFMLTGYFDDERSADGDQEKYEWFLNRIEHAHCSENELILEGICSPVISQAEFASGPSDGPDP